MSVSSTKRHLSESNKHQVVPNELQTPYNPHAKETWSCSRIDSTTISVLKSQFLTSSSKFVLKSNAWSLLRNTWLEQDWCSYPQSRAEQCHQIWWLQKLSHLRSWIAEFVRNNVKYTLFINVNSLDTMLFKRIQLVEKMNEQDLEFRPTVQHTRAFRRFLTCVS